MRVNREVAIYLRAVNRMDVGLRSAEASLKGFVNSTTRMFRDLGLAIGAAFTALTAFSMYMGTQFERALANTSSMFITAAGSAQEMDKWMGGLEATARTLGANTAYTATEAANAMYSLASGGLNAKEVMEATESVLHLAGATMSDMSSAAELMMSTLRQYNLEATESARVANVFAAAIQNSMLTMERLHYSMQYTGPVAARLGLSIEETAAALALMHNAGLKGSLAGTGMRQVMIRLIRPNEELERVLRGVSVTADGFVAVIERLKEYGLRPDQAARMFGQRTLAAISVLMSAGREGLEEMQRRITGTNAAMDAYAVQMDTVGAQMTILKSIAQELGLTIFDVFKPDLRKGIDLAQRALKAMIPNVKTFYEGIRELAIRWVPKAIDTLGRLVGIVLIVRDRMREAVQMAASYWPVLVYWIERVRDTLLDLARRWAPFAVEAFNLIAEAAKGFADAIGVEFKGAAEAIPGLIDGVGRAGEVIIEFGGKAIAAMINFGTVIVNLSKSIWDKIGPTVKENKDNIIKWGVALGVAAAAVGPLIAKLMVFWPLLVKLASVAGKFLGIIGRVGWTLLKAITIGIVPAIAWVKNMIFWIQLLASVLMDWVRATLPVFVNALKTGFTKAMVAVRAFGMMLWGLVVANPLGALVVAIGAGLTALIVMWRKKAGSWKMVWEEMKYSAKVSGLWIKDQWDRLGIGIKKGWLLIKSTFMSMAEYLTGFAKGGFTSTIKGMRDLIMEAFKEPWKGIDWNKFGEVFENAWGDAKTAAEAGVAELEAATKVELSILDEERLIDKNAIRRQVRAAGDELDRAREEVRREQEKVADENVPTIVPKLDVKPEMPDIEWDRWIEDAFGQLTEAWEGVPYKLPAPKLADEGAFAMPEANFTIDDMPMSFTDPFEGELHHFEKWHNSLEIALDHAEDLYEDSWDTIWDTTRTGSEKWLDIWHDTFSKLGDMFLTFFKEEIVGFDESFFTELRAKIGNINKEKFEAQRANETAGAMKFGAAYEQEQFEIAMNERVMNNYVETMAVQEEVFRRSQDGKRQSVEEYFAWRDQKELEQAVAIKARMMEEAATQEVVNFKKMQSESVYTNYVETNAAVRTASSNAETTATVTNYVEKTSAQTANIAVTETETAATTKSAIAKFFDAHAWLPFVGYAIAAAFIGKMLSAFHDGGLIGGPSATAGDKTEQVFLGQKGEFVMPAEETRKYLPVLEQMRSGGWDPGTSGTFHNGGLIGAQSSYPVYTSMQSDSPAFSAAGDGGGSSGPPQISVAVNVPASSLLMADDKLAVRRFAEAIHDEIEYQIKPSIGD